MQRETRIQRVQRSYTVAVVCLALAIANIPNQSFALIEGGKGNRPVADSGWPEGAAAIFNHKGRIAWWVADGFPGWHADCRGDAESLNAVLANYAKLDVKTKRLVVHNGLGNSYLLNPNREPDKMTESWIQWSFMVLGNPTGRNRRGAELGPPAQIDLYTGGKFRWEDVKVPEGIVLIDQRLEAHGFALEDGIVLIGKVTDLATGKPVVGRIQLQRIESQPKGPRRYIVVAKTVANEEGQWVLKKTPAGWYRVVVLADGYAPRVIGHDRFDDRPQLHSYKGELAPAAVLSGTVVDQQGKPLRGVDVRLGDVVSVAGGRYLSTSPYRATTDGQGKFRIGLVPVGEATIRLQKAGYARLGTQPISMPAGGIKLTMMKTAKPAEVQVTVDFTGKKRPKQYIVDIEHEPKGAAAVGNWGGSGFIDANDQIVFRNVPPGRYVLQGHPNPSTSRQRTDPLIIELKEGKLVQITLPAK